MMMYRMLLSLLIVAALPATARGDEPSLDVLIEEATRSSQRASLEQARPLIDQLLERIDQASPEQQARIRHLQIRWLARSGDYAQSLELAERTLRDSPQIEQAAALHRLAANVAIYAGSKEQAFRHLHRAIDILATRDNAYEHALTLLLASQLLAEAGNTTRAVEHALTGLEYSRQVEDVRIRCALTGFAIAALNADQQPRRALEIADQGLATCRQIDDPAILGSILNKLAETRLNLGQIEAVGPLLEEAEALLRGHYDEGLRFNRLLAARLLLAEGQFNRALELANALVEEFERLNLWRRVDAVLEVKARAHEALGQQEQLYQTRQQQLTARERHLNRSRLLSLANAEVGFEALRNQRELALLNEQARVRALREQTEQSQARIRLLLTSIVAAVLLLSCALLWRTWRERRQFAHLAVHDGLTAIANHTAFFAELDQRIEQAHSSQQTLSLVLADIDHFKQINDRLGHAAGDDILRATARALQSCFDAHGTTGRIGGEEFAACLPGATAAQARSLAEDFSDLVKQSGGGDQPPRLTVSIGIAQLLPGESAEQLRARADQALYAAKQRGRNQVMLA